jgi:hypothetical protein
MDKQAGHLLITNEELSALMAPDSGEAPSNGLGFRFRNFFLLALVSVQTIRLMFFRHVVVTQFQTEALDAQTLHRYMEMRGLFIMVISGIYLFSYLKNWYFEKVALLYVGIAITALLMDYLNAYIYFNPQPVHITLSLTMLRLAAIYCLVMNAWYAKQAPAMPRYLWS